VTEYRVRKSLLGIAILLVLGISVAVAEEMTVAPAYHITGPVALLPWTGVYFGANGGYGFANSSIAYLPNDPASLAGTCGGTGHGQCIPSADFHRDGALAGGQVGFNWQVNPFWLIGVETDYQWSNFKTTTLSNFHLGNVGVTGMITDESVTSFGTLRLRVGVLPVTALLLYGTGGLAYGHIGTDYNVPAVGTGAVTAGGFSYSCVAGGPACFAGASSKTAVGWTAGAGGEYAITNNLTFKAELLYVVLDAPGGTAVAQGTTAGTVPASFTVNFSQAHFAALRVGANLRF
jgi:outer membrane immunogenic protein